MPFVELNQSQAREIFPGFKAHVVHSANMTFAHWTIKAGATLPAHAHVHEQVVNMIEGVFELSIAGETRSLGQGSVAIIPSNALHSARVKVVLLGIWLLPVIFADRIKGIDDPAIGDRFARVERI